MAIIGSVVVDCHASTENRGSVFLTKNRTATTVATLGTFKTGRIRTFVIKRFILFIIKITYPLATTILCRTRYCSCNCYNFVAGIEHNQHRRVQESIILRGKK